MKSSLKISSIEIILLIVTIFIALLFTSPRLTSQLIYKPAGHIYVGMSTYFEDFYYYLDQFYQGKEGKWLTENRFSIEKFPSAPIYLNHIILGKIGGLFGLESFQAYNAFGLFFKMCFMLSGYIVISLFFPHSLVYRLSTFLIFLFSTAFPNISIQNGMVQINPPIDVFRTENRILARFGTSPNGMLVNFLFMILFIVLLKIYKKEKDQSVIQPLNRKQIFVISLCFILMIFGDSIKPLILLVTFTVLLIFHHISVFSFNPMPKLKKILLFLYLLLLILGGYILISVSKDPVYRDANLWDVNQYLQQIKALGLSNFIKGFGLQFPLFIYGLYLIAKKKTKTLLETAAVIMVSISWMGYLLPLFFQIPVPGFRSVFPATYVFMSIMVFHGLEQISSKFHIKNAHFVTLAVYLGINFFTFLNAWAKEIQPLTEPEYHFAYIPDELYQGLVYLRTAEPKDGNVLASPYTSTDLMIPGISGRYTYTGHFLTTYNSKEKDALANKFFNEWTDRPETHEFLRANNIRFIVVTKYSARLNDIKTYYPFLKVIFENSTITIFRYDGKA